MLHTHGCSSGAGAQVRCTVLTSGTLSPLASFAEELRLGPALTLENPHVIDASQVWLGIVPVGPRGHALNSSHAQRESKGYKDDLGCAVANFARQVGCAGGPPACHSSQVSGALVVARMLGACMRGLGRTAPDRGTGADGWASAAICALAALAHAAAPMHATSSRPHADWGRRAPKGACSALQPCGLCLRCLRQPACGRCQTGCWSSSPATLRSGAALRPGRCRPSRARRPSGNASHARSRPS